MPAPKSLEQHVSSRSFRSRRHHELLAGPALPWPALAELQGHYAAAAHELERRAIGVDFERAVRELPDDQERASEPELEPGELTLQQIIDMPPEEYDPAKERAASERAARVLFARDAHRVGMPLKDEDWVPLTVAQISARLGVSATTVRRYLAETAERER